MQDEWYVYPASTQKGPYSGAELKRLASEGFLTPTDLLQEEGKIKALPASAATGLFATEALPTPLGRSPDVSQRSVDSNALGQRRVFWRPSKWTSRARACGVAVVCVAIILMRPWTLNRPGEQSTAQIAANPASAAVGSVQSPSHTSTVRSDEAADQRQTAPSYTYKLLEVPTRKLDGTRAQRLFYSSDGKSLMSMSRDINGAAVRQLDPESGQATSTTFPFHDCLIEPLSNEQVQALTMPANQQSSRRDRIMRLTRERGPVVMKYSPSAKFAAHRKGLLKGDDKSIVILDVETGNTVPLKDVELGEEDEIVQLAFSPDQKFFALSTMKSTGGGRTGTVRVWDIGSASLAATLSYPAIRHLQFSPDSRLLVAQNHNIDQTGGEAVVLWETGKWSKKAVLKPEGKNYNFGIQLAFSPDGKFLATTEDAGSATYRVSIWSADSGQKVSGFSLFEFNSFAFSPSGDLLATWGGERPHQLNLWEVGTGHLKYRIKHGFCSLSCFAPDGKSVIAISNMAKTLGWYVWNLEGGTDSPFEDEAESERKRVADAPDLTRTAPAISRAAYDSITIGMTPLDVREAFGGLGESVATTSSRESNGKFGYKINFRTVDKYKGKKGYALFTYEGWNDLRLVSKQEFGLE